MKRVIFISVVLLLSQIPFRAYGIYNDPGDALLFFREIPKFDKISFTCNNIEFVINPNYTISIRGSYASGDEHASIVGEGLLIWNAERAYMDMDVNFTVSGNYSSSRPVYRTEQKYRQGSVANNIGAFLFGGEYQSNTTTEQVYDHTEYYYASGSTSYKEKYPLYVCNGYCCIYCEKTYSTTLTGDVTRFVSFKVDKQDLKLTFGAARTDKGTYTDEFGSWQWNLTRTDIWLKPDNVDGVELHISPQYKRLYIETGNILLGGKSLSETTDGSVLTLFKFAFEDGQTVDLPFAYSCYADVCNNTVNYLIVNKDTIVNQNAFIESMTNDTIINQTDSTEIPKKVFVYGSYNRFLDNWNYDASSIIDQIKTKQLLMFTYKKDGQEYTAMFELEGLEAILSYL